MPSFRRCDRCGRTLSSRTQETARAFSSQPRRGILVPNGVATPWSSKSLQSKRRPSPGAGQARGRAWLSLDLNALGAPVFVFDLKRFAGFVRGLGLVLGAMWTSEVGDTISRTTSTPPRRAARGVRSGGAHAPPLSTSTLHSQQESSETRAILLLIDRGTPDIGEWRPNRRKMKQNLLRELSKRPADDAHRRALSIVPRMALFHLCERGP